MAEISHRIGIQAPISKVFQAISTIEGLSGWWTENTSGTSAPGGRIQFDFKRDNGEILGTFVMSVASIEGDKKVHWKVIDGDSEWVGTDLIFELSKQDDYTILLFSHKNWRELTESTYHCSMKWATFLLSLKQFVLTGKGRPSPHDLKIDNWN